MDVHFTIYGISQWGIWTSLVLKKIINPDAEVKHMSMKIIFFIKIFILMSM